MTTDYTEMFQDADAVEKYEHVVYAPDSYASRINERQRAYLRGLVEREFADRRPVQHDFACGTGRAIRIAARAGPRRRTATTRRPRCWPRPREVGRVRRAAPGAAGRPGAGAGARRAARRS